jgi:hypothetical protein
MFLFILKFWIANKQQNSNLMYWKHVNTRSSYCVSMVVVYRIWWAQVGTLSDFATLLHHNAAKRLLTPGLENVLYDIDFLPPCLTHWRLVMQICVFCVFALQLWKIDDTNLRFNTRLVFMHLITQYMECFFDWSSGPDVKKKRDFTLN